MSTDDGNLDKLTRQASCVSNEDNIATLRERDVGQRPGRAITRAEALAISRATIENAEAARTASDTVVALLEENARLRDELAAIKAQSCATCRYWVPGHKRLGTCQYHGYPKNIVTDTDHRCDYHVIKENA